VQMAEQHVQLIHWDEKRNALNEQFKALDRQLQLKLQTGDGEVLNLIQRELHGHNQDTRPVLGYDAIVSLVPLFVLLPIHASMQNRKDISINEIDRLREWPVFGSRYSFPLMKVVPLVYCKAGLDEETREILTAVDNIIAAADNKVRDEPMQDLHEIYPKITRSDVRARETIARMDGSLVYNGRVFVDCDSTRSAVISICRWLMQYVLDRATLVDLPTDVRNLVMAYEQEQPKQFTVNGMDLRTKLVKALLEQIQKLLLTGETRTQAISRLLARRAVDQAVLISKHTELEKELRALTEQRFDNPSTREDELGL
jgi:hypothetical protein